MPTKNLRNSFAPFHHFKPVYLFFLAWCLGSCSHNAITGRSQLHLFPDSEVQSLASDQYSKFIASNKVIGKGTSNDADMVHAVGKRLTDAINQYYADKGLTKEL